MQRNLRFWQFPFRPQNFAIFWSLLNFYYILINIHHLATSMPKISFPSQFLVWKIKMLQPVPSNWQISIFTFFFVLTSRFSVFHLLRIFVSPNVTPSCIIPTDCALDLNRGQVWRHFGPSNEFHSWSVCIAAPCWVYIWNGSRCLNQLCDAFGETWGHFPDAGAFSPRAP